MKIFKRLSLFLIVMFMAVSVTACSDNSNNNNQNNNNGNNNPIKYTVTFIVDDETYETKKVTAGEKVEEPTTPSKAHYEFLGWYSNELKWDFNKNTINGNVTLKAKFEIISYDITFKIGEDTIKSFKVNSGDKLEKPEDPSKEYNLFGGWYDGETKWDFENDTASKNMTLTAKFLSDIDEDGYKIIFTKEQFKDYALNPVNYKKNARLYADINLAGIEWTPIGNDRDNYSAIFDGNGFTVSNFKITTIKIDEYYNAGQAGLFGTIYNAEIKNLNVENFEFEIKREVLGTEELDCGGIVGFAVESTISNCSVKGELTVTGNQIYIGGLLGYAYKDVTILNSFAKCDISAKSYGLNSISAGGLVGCIYDNASSYITSSSTITSCYATGNISAISTEYRAYAGGLIGNIDNNAIISSCYATGNSYASSATDNAYSGGLIGSVIGSVITDVYATGNAVSEGSQFSYAGGLMGSADSTKISYAYATGNSESSSYKKAYAGGLVSFFTNYKHLEKITITNAYAMGNAKSTVTTSSGVTAIAGGFIAYSLDVDEFVNCYKNYEQTLTSIINKTGTANNGAINYNGTSNDLAGILAFVSEYFFADKWNISTESHPTLIF